MFIFSGAETPSLNIRRILDRTVSDMKQGKHGIDSSNGVDGVVSDRVLAASAAARFRVKNFACLASSVSDSANLYAVSNLREATSVMRQTLQEYRSLYKGSPNTLFYWY